jgi:alpha-tubulin suppressor-like RCC1 family protein
MAKYSLGHGDEMDCRLPKPIESLRGIKVDAVVASYDSTLALADDGSVYAWGRQSAAEWGVLGLGPSVNDAEEAVPTPQRIPGLRLTCGGT